MRDIKVSYIPFVKGWFSDTQEKIKVYSTGIELYSMTSNRGGSEIDIFSQKSL